MSAAVLPHFVLSKDLYSLFASSSDNVASAPGLIVFSYLFISSGVFVPYLVATLACIFSALAAYFTLQNVFQNVSLATMPTPAQATVSSVSIAAAPTIIASVPIQYERSFACEDLPIKKAPSLSRVASEHVLHLVPTLSRHQSGFVPVFASESILTQQRQSALTIS